MKNLKMIKNLAAASALVLTAGFVHAQAVSVDGNFGVSDCTPSNDYVTGSINIDQDATTPSPTLAYLFNVTITTTGYTCGSKTYSAGSWTTALGAGGIAPAGLPEWTDPTTENPNGTWSVIYLWGDHTTDSNAAGSFSGSLTGIGNDPDWDAAALAVTVDGVNYSPISISLTTWEYTSSSTNFETTYTLAP